MGKPPPSPSEPCGPETAQSRRQGQRSSSPPLGVILAGGQATRMGGGDKGLRLLDGRPLLAHVIERLAPQVSDIVLNANGAPERFADFGLPVVSDTLYGWPGPLAGVLAGMDRAAAQGTDTIVTVAADTPFFPHDLVTRLIEAAAPSGVALAATRAEGRLWHHPTFGLWPVRLFEDLHLALGRGQRKTILWAERHGAGTAEFSTTPFDPFFNINTPEDLQIAETLMGQA
ncbi:MAG: molybdenum cofactor guanylyltransferase MobA [Rhodobacteraceae bacterium]|nr:MAG: molybdenum cofactor guanylyltransferase MobA [Paracoccaceae bacterium]